MRHRYRIDLYDDVELEAKLVDLVESMPRSRRQEFLRTMIKIGFLHSYGSMEPSISDPQSIPRMPPQAMKEKQGVKRASRERSVNQTPDAHKETSEDDYAQSNQRIAEPELDARKEEIARTSESQKQLYKKSASNNDSINIPSINTSSDIEEDKYSDMAEEDVVDSLDEFKGLFDDLNDN